jgi:hypothetical protein
MLNGYKTGRQKQVPQRIKNGREMKTWTTCSKFPHQNFVFIIFLPYLSYIFFFFNWLYNPWWVLASLTTVLQASLSAYVQTISYKFHYSQTLGDLYKSRSSSLCNVPKCALTLSILSPHIFLSIVFEHLKLIYITCSLYTLAQQPVSSVS